MRLRLRLFYWNQSPPPAVPFLMIPFLFVKIVGYAWMTLGLVYLLGVVRTKRTVQRQSSDSRRLQLGMTILGYFLIFWRLRPYSPFNLRLIPLHHSLLVLGAALTVAGCLLAIWARVMLGANWSMNVTLKQQHALMTRGPYAFVRHPIYTGLLLAALGTAIVYGAAHCFLGVAVLFYGFWLKLHTEEEFMLQQFGAQYVAYKEHVRALIPGVL